MQPIHPSSRHPVSVVTEPSPETSWDVKQLVNYDLFLLCRREVIKTFRDDLNGIVSFQTETLLPNLRKRVHPSNDGSRFGSDAPNADEPVLRNVSEAQCLDQLIRQEFHVGGREVLDWHGGFSASRWDKVLCNHCANDRVMTRLGLSTSREDSDRGAAGSWRSPRSCARLTLTTCSTDRPHKKGLLRSRQFFFMSVPCTLQRR